MDKDPEEVKKWRFLAGAPHADALHPEIQVVADALWKVAKTRDAYLELVHCLARDVIRYATDTARVGTEDIAGYTREPKRNDAVEALHRRLDDCDAKARLFVALCLAKGIRAKMQPLWESRAGNLGRLAHVYAAVLIDERWLPVECTLKRARIGDEPKAVPFERGKKDWLR